MIVNQARVEQSNCSQRINRSNYNFGAMSKFKIAIRLNVLNPPKGVAMRVQKGRDELLEPSSDSSKALVFDFPITVDLSDKTPNFLGEFAQGPKTARFVYVNSGTYAGQADSCWGRRAK